MAQGLRDNKKTILVDIAAAETNNLTAALKDRLLLEIVIILYFK